MKSRIARFYNQYKMKADSTAKEPSLYTFQIMTAVFAVVFGIMVHRKVRADVVCGCLIAYLALVVLQQGVAAIRQARCNPYSYNIIYYRGFFLFFLILLGTTIQYSRGFFQVPEAFSSRDIIWFITDSFLSYLKLTVPVVVAFSVWLLISNIRLIRSEGKRFVNVLGILLAIMLTGFLLLLLYFGVWHYEWVPEKYHFAVTLVINLFSVLYLYVECMLLGAFLAVFSVARYEPVPDRDFIIILGCRIRKDGTPTPLLRGRVDRAIAFYKKQKEETGKMPVFVTSGGKGSDEVKSESASMKAYLLEQGIPDEQIIEEDKSENTYQNMLFSKEKIDAVNPDAKVAFSTTSYHVFRSGLYARRVKMTATGMGQPTKWWFWPNATVREIVGLMTEHKGRQALILGTFVVICTVLTILSFR